MVIIHSAALEKRKTWSRTNSQERRLDVNEMRTLRSMREVTKKNEIRTEHVKVTPVTKKITEEWPK